MIDKGEVIMKGSIRAIVGLLVTIGAAGGLGQLVQPLDGQSVPRSTPEKVKSGSMNMTMPAPRYLID